MDNQHTDAAVLQQSQPLVNAIKRLLRPLVRLLIARALPLQLVVDLLKRLYVEVADEQFPVEGKRQSDSRINLLTGVHRKDVRRLRNQRRRRPTPPRAATLGSQLIARWTTLPEYLDADGNPLRLPRVAAQGKQPSFEGLVRSVNKDIRPRVVLDEWLRLGIAEIDEAGRIRLNVNAFVPPPGSEEIAYYFGRNLHDHVAAAVHNVLGEPEPFLERSVAYNHLSQTAVDELTALAKEQGMRLLQDLNARALSLQQRDRSTSGATGRINFGVYLFSEDEPLASDDSPDDSDDKP